MFVCSGENVWEDPTHFFLSCMFSSVLCKSVRVFEIPEVPGMIDTAGRQVKIPVEEKFQCIVAP